jgi:hypothetical protein
MRLRGSVSRDACKSMLLVVAGFWVWPLQAQTIPKTWDEQALAGALLPPPVPGVTVKLAPAAYYFRMRERVM